MKEQFIPYELALKLKELGFDEECLAYYDGSEEFIYGLNIKDISFTKKYHKETDAVLVPLWQQAFEWFEIRYGLFSYIEPVLVEKAKSPLKYDFQILSMDDEEEDYKNLPYHTKSEAQTACLRKLIEIVKSK